MGTCLMAEAPSPAVDHARLVQAYVQGDGRAGDALAATVYRLSLRRIRVDVACSEAAEDLAQDCVLLVLSRLSEFDPHRASFEAWVHGFTLNAIRSYRRREFRGRTLPLPSEERYAPQAPARDLDQESVLGRGRGSLETKERALLHMRFALGMSSEEIAAAMGLNAPLIRKRLSRAVERLRRFPAISGLVR